MKTNKPLIVHPDNLLPGLQGAFLTSPFLNNEVNQLYTPRVQGYISMYHLNVGNPGCTDNDEEIPLIQKPKSFVPQSVWPFHQVKSHLSPTNGAHFYVDDFIMMRFIRHPMKYIPILRQCGCVLSLDLSTYQELRLPIVRNNIYWNRLFTQELQKQGVNAIPAVQWRDRKSFAFCFLGIPKGSAIALSTVGVLTSQISLQIWKEGALEAIRQIEPEMILFYGEKVDFDFGSIEVHYLENQAVRRLRNYGR